MTPIAEKSLGTDPVSGLTRKIQVYNIIINSDDETVIVYYRTVLETATGTQFTEYSDSYTRYNSPTNNKFDQLRASSVGTGIEGLIGIDMAGINSFVDFQTLQQQLAQN